MGRFLSILILSVLTISVRASPLIVFVTGDHEYSSERTMPRLAAALEKNFGCRTQVLYATKPNGDRDETYEQNIPGLIALKSADLAIFFLRWRQLPAEQMQFIQNYLDSGKPLVGFRTTSHAFHYPPGHPLEKWNAFGEFAFGTPPGWGAAGHTHYGHESTTVVTAVAAASNNPILDGVITPFSVPSWLYRVRPQFPPADANVLLMGEAIHPDKPAIPNPVAWTWRTSQGARSFYTSLGHPQDFAVESFQRLVVNAIFWALQRPEPNWPGPLDLAVPYEKTSHPGK